MIEKPSLSSILVAVRVRPFSLAEQDMLNQTQKNPFSFASPASLSKPVTSKKGQLKKIVYALDDHVIAFDPPEESVSLGLQKGFSRMSSSASKHRDARFAFDRVFNEDASQEDVFEGTSRELIDEVLNGFNSTVFAYGATGCGKTHTMCGTQDQPGIIFLTMKELYGRINSAEGEVRFVASLSYLEVYNETIRDLLCNDQDRLNPLNLREDAKQGIVVPGLVEKFPNSVEEMMAIIMQGNKRRTVSATEANATSSRSHAVLQINIRQSHGTPVLSKEYTFATLSFIDLAGSERAAATSNLAVRKAEGVKINTSLLALGNCIEALSKNKPGEHIPYRASKLTRLLKFSLGGNCKTVMIVCVSPVSTHFEETLNTLKYADRAKKIKTKIARNTLNVNLHIAQYPKQIQELKQEVAMLKKQLAQEKERNSGLIDASLDEHTQRRQVSLLQELRHRLRTYQEAICTRELECRKKSFLLDLYNERIALLQCWLDACQKHSSAHGKQHFNTVPGLQQGLKDKADTLDALARNLATLTENVNATFQEARLAINSQAAELLEQDRELIVQEFNIAYSGFVIESYQMTANLDAETVRAFADSNAAMLLNFKEFIARCGAKGLDVSYIDQIYLLSITAFAVASRNIASVPSTASRPSTPNRLLPVEAMDQPKRRLAPSPILHSPHHTTAMPLRSILSSGVKDSAKRKRVKFDACSPRPSKEPPSRRQTNRGVATSRQLKPASKPAPRLSAKPTPRVSVFDRLRSSLPAPKPKLNPPQGFRATSKRPISPMVKLAPHRPISPVGKPGLKRPMSPFVKPTPRRPISPAVKATPKAPAVAQPRALISS
ncbi:tubulin-dependent ATPase kip3, partial [Massospora cicadina]